VNDQPAKFSDEVGKPLPLCTAEDCLLLHIQHRSAWMHELNLRPLK
jgi:hypothetical protein